MLEKNGNKIDALRFAFSVYKYGYPNDEVGHPLSKYGLGFYGFFKVHNSPWIEEIKNHNRHHPGHSDSMYDDREHYIVKFKDVTLEVICREMEEVELTKEEVDALINKEIDFLEP